MRTQGFTLIELIVTVAVVAILASIAYPSYVEHLRTSRRADAAGALIGFAAAMERHYASKGSYLGAGEGNGDTGAPGPALGYSATVPVGGGTVTYNLSIQAATANSYSLYAIPTGSQFGDKCGTLTLNQMGTQGIQDAQSGVSAKDCWRR